jgi:integrase
VKGHVASKNRKDRRKGPFYIVLNGRWYSGQQLIGEPFMTKREAREAMADLLSKAHRGEMVEPSRQTLADYLEAWLRKKKAGGMRPSTWDSYSRNIRHHIIPAVGKVPLQKLSAQHLDDLYAGLRSERVLPSGRRGRPLSARTIRYVHVILHAALKDAVRKRLVVRNVADEADPPKSRDTKPKPPKAWSAEELRRFLDHVGDDPLYPAWLTLAMTGMRRGELLGLRWRDLDPKAGRVSIERAITAIGYEVVVTQPKTPRSRRSVALDPQTISALKGLPRSLDPDALLFPGVHPDEFSKAFARHVKAAGLPKLSVHGLRHTHASLALAAGVHPKVISERLGHSTISLTLDTYSHSIPSLQEEAATTIAGVIFG